MGKIGKGTGSFGKRHNKSHTLCRRYVLPQLQLLDEKINAFLGFVCCAYFDSVRRTTHVY